MNINIKAVSETLTLYLKEHCAIADFNTIASTGFYSFCCCHIILFIHRWGVERKAQHIQVLLIKEKSCCVLTACTGKRS